MQTLTAQMIAGKCVLMRMDLDVPLKKIQKDGATIQVVAEDYRLKAGLSSLDLCLQHAQSVIIMGHLGRPKGEDPEFSIKPIVDWLEQKYAKVELPEGKLHVLENLRFEEGEDGCDPKFADELACLGTFYINESFAAHHKAASTTMITDLLPHAAGLHFAKEVEILTRIKQDPHHPLVVIIGGAKIEDKLPVVLEMSKIAQAVLVGGKLPEEMNTVDQIIPSNVFVGKLNAEQTDIAPETAESWRKIIAGAKMIVWNGPMGFVEDPKNDQSKLIAQMVVDSGAETILGGGDTVTYVDKLGLLDKFTFVSTGGGAMLKFLAEGTLPTIEALK